MAFDFYEHLGAKQKRTYRKSDEVPRIDLPDSASLGLLLDEVEKALTADDRAALSKATIALASAILTQLDVPQLVVRVLARRPSDSESELHGLYVREEKGPAVIRVWMRTAAHVRPVRFRTFVRTLAHELLHHLDFELLELDDTFHTEGFFRRESDLVKQLLGENRRAPRPAVAARPKPAVQPTGEQLSLFGAAEPRKGRR